MHLLIIEQMLEARYSPDAFQENSYLGLSRAGLTEGLFSYFSFCHLRFSEA